MLITIPFGKVQSVALDFSTIYVFAYMPTLLTAALTGLLEGRVVVRDWDR